MTKIKLYAYFLKKRRWYRRRRKKENDKIYLVIKVCYAVAQFCGPGIESTVTYDSFYDCGVAGYKYCW